MCTRHSLGLTGANLGQAPRALSLRLARAETTHPGRINRPPTISNLRVFREGERSVMEGGVADSRIICGQQEWIENDFFE